MDTDQIVAHLMEIKENVASVRGDIAAVKVDVKNVSEVLKGSNGTEGLITVVAEHTNQITFWRGVIAIISFLILALGGTLLAHVIGGK